MSDRFSHLVIAALLMLGGVTLGCDKSPSGPSSSAALTVATVFPDTGPTEGVVELRIVGSGFRKGATVTLDEAAANVVVLSSSVITATAPSHAAGAVDLVVTNVGGESGRLPAAFTYVPVAITSLSPTGGLLTGETLSIVGTGFVAGATVTLDGVAARVSAVGPSVITATAPVHVAGAVDVVVTNPSGQSAALVQAYTYGSVAIGASPSVVLPGGRLTLSWTAPAARRSVGDWIALFRAGDPDSVANSANFYGWSAHFEDNSGTWTIDAPTQPGEYRFRYMIGNSSVARSSVVTVSASASLSIPSDQAREK